MSKLHFTELNGAMRRSVLLHFSVLLGLLLMTFAAPREYPLFKQCDPRWGAHEMGVPGAGERSTICGEGCAMTSLAMVLNALQVPYPGAPLLIDPGNFNAWLMANGGYVCDAGDCNNLVLGAVERLTPLVSLIGELPTPPFSDIVRGLRNGTVGYIAHVAALHHFVLLVSSDGHQNFTVRDPFYNATSYAHDAFSDILMYALK